MADHVQEDLRKELANCVSLLSLIRSDYLRPRELPHSVDAAILAGRAALAKAETAAAEPEQASRA